MPAKRFIYWDSCVFAAYISQEPGRANIIRAVWDSVAGNQLELESQRAIHLATALWVHQNIHPVTVFHTYDARLAKYTNLLAGIPIREPGFD